MKKSSSLSRRDKERRVDERGPYSLRGGGDLSKTCESKKKRNFAILIEMGGSLDYPRKRAMAPRSEKKITSPTIRGARR